MTEEEAKKKWCPYGLVAIQSGSFNRSFDYDGAGMKHDSCFCIASDCMAWRNEIEFIEDDEGISLKEPADGYCGLAGKP